jgi:hypothetical protein
MRIKFIFVVILGSAGLYACKVSQQALAITPDDTTYASSRWTGSTQEELQKGFNIYTNKCNECHKIFSPDKFSVKKWEHEIEDMAPKAKLTDIEKEQLYRYIMSRNYTMTAGKQKK